MRRKVRKPDESIFEGGLHCKGSCGIARYLVCIYCSRILICKYVSNPFSKSSSNLTWTDGWLEEEKPSEMEPELKDVSFHFFGLLNRRP